MYIPDHFRMRPTDVAAFLDATPAGTLITTDPATHRPMASFLPWCHVAGDRLTSHLGAVNPQATHSGEALVILMGDNAYIDSSWMDDGAVPTWDYETVHIYGELTTHTDPDWIIAAWADMLQRFASSRVGDFDRVWLEKMAPAVVGLEIRVTEIQAKSKLSQNRSAAEAASIAGHLDATCPALAGRVRDVALPHIGARDERVRAAAAGARRV